MFKSVKWILWLVVLPFFFFSCEKENYDGMPGYSKVIGYQIGIGENSKGSLTKSGELRSSRSVVVEELGVAAGGQTLFLHTISEDRADYLRYSGRRDTAATKGAINTGISSLGISGCVYNGDAFTYGNVYMANDKSESPSWNSNRYWPKDYDHIRFFAYAPYDIVIGDSDSDYLRLAAAGAWDGGNPSFTYIVPSEITDHTDVLVASSDVPKANYGMSAHLEFGHALTAIQFMVDGLYQFNIKKITLQGVPYNKGTYTYSYNGSNGDGNSATPTHDAGEWSNLASAADGGAALSYELDFTNGGTVPDGYVCDGSREVILNTGNDVLFVMPQDLPESVILIMEAHDVYTGKDVKISASIGGNGKSWRKGEHIIYKISLTDIDVQYVLSVTGTTASAPFYGEINRDYNVVSYKIIHKMGEQYPTYEAVPWKISGQSTWVDGITLAAGNGSTVTASAGSITGTTSEAGTYGVVAITPEWFDPFYGTYGNWYSSHHALRDNVVLGEEGNEYDLSGGTNGTPGSTANCYIVYAPGYYKLPLAYGNAIKDGADNSSSYRPAVSQGTAIAQQVIKKSASNYEPTGIYESVAVFVLTPFVDHLGTGISSPWIVSNNGRGGKYAAGFADLVWQDQPCMLTDIELSEKKDYLTFRVREDCITEGNAVVALKDANGVIMWSWHIWVTDGRNIYDNPAGGVLTFNPEDNNHTGENIPSGDNRLRDVRNRVVVNTSDGVRFRQNTFYMMNAHIGQCDGEGRRYTPREGNIVFQQMENGEAVGVAAELAVPQGGNEAVEIVTPDNAVYFQYGRKDPMLPGYALNGTVVNKTYYLGDRTQRTGFSPSADNNFVGYAAMQGSLAESIQNPGTFYGTSNRDFPTINSNDVDYILVNHWCSNGVFYNLWDASNNVLPMFAYTQVMNDTKYGFFDNFTQAISDQVVKTVYDPCPRGYEMPRTDAFTGFTYDGMSRRNSDMLGVNMTEETWDNFTSYNGYTFYDTPMPSERWADSNNPGSDNTLLIQALGHRNANSGDVAQYGKYGGALTTIPICVQWAIEGKIQENYTPPTNATAMGNDDQIQNYFQLQLSRFCFINSSLANGDGGESRTFRPISSSDLDYAFPVIPVKTGNNPLAGSDEYVEIPSS